MRVEKAKPKAVVTLPPGLNPALLDKLDLLSDAELRDMIGQLDFLNKKSYRDYKPHPKQLLFHMSPAKIRLMLGGNRCLGGEQLIYDPVLKISRRVQDIKDDWFHIWAYNGKKLVIGVAQKPFYKDVDKIYDVKFSNGEVLSCSLSHVILAEKNVWRAVSELQPGCEIYRPHSNLGYVLSILFSSVQHCWRKVRDFLYDCLAYPYSYGGQLRTAGGNVANVSPLQADVQEHTSCEACEQKDDYYNKSLCNHLGQLNDHRSNSDVRHRNAVPFFGILYDFFCRLYILISDLYEVVVQSKTGFYLVRSIRGFVQWGRNLIFSYLPLVVISIVYKRDDVKWDFTVLDYHNYFAGGVVNHNTGKSLSGIEEDIWHLTGDYPEWYPANKRWLPPVFGRYVATDFKKGVGGVFQPYFEELVPLQLITRITRTQQGNIEKVRFTNGSILDVMTNEMDTEVFEGWRGHFCHFDEPVDRDKYIACARGLIDFKGRCWFTLTPLSQAWIFDELYNKEDSENFAITIDIRDNPYINKDEIDHFSNQLTEDEQEARLHGKFMHLAGVVYKEFNREVHRIEPFEIPIDWKRIQGIDPHDRKPHAIGWFAVDPFDNIYIYDELEKHGTVEMASKEIVSRETSGPFKLDKRSKINFRFIDPNKGKSPSQVGKQGTLVDEFAKFGLHYYAGVNDNLADGHLMVEWYLQYDKTKPIDMGNRPKLYVFNTCKLFMHGFTHYVWDDYSNSDNKDQKEKPKDKNKDFMDLVRYCCMLKPKYQQAVAKENTNTESITGY